MRLLSFYAVLIIVSTAKGDSDLRDLTERFFQWRIKEFPEYGTKLGIHDHDESVQEYSEAAFTRQMQGAQKFLNESYKINYESLSENDRFTLDVLRNNIETFRAGYELRKFGMYNLITPMERPTQDWEKFVSQMKFNTESDYRKYLTRLSKFPKQITQKLNLMRMAIQNGITAHRVSLTGAADELNEKFIVSSVNQSVLYQPFLKFPSSFSPQLQESLRKDAEFEILQKIVPSILELREFIDHEYGPVTRSNISVSSLPGGQLYYKACLRWHTTVDWSPEVIHNKGVQEVARITTLIDKIKEESGFRGSIKDYVKYLNNQSENFFNTENELKDGYEQIIRKVHGNLNRVLYRVPQQKLEVIKSTNHQARTARYFSPPLDGSRSAAFVAKLDNPTTRPKYRMPAVSLHEAEPGHHTQFSYTIDENLPTFRRMIEYRNYNAVPFNWPFYTGYVEGWALYAESLGNDLDAYPDSKALFGKYESELFRASRLVVDTGIHAFGWSREEAVQYLYDNSALSYDECQDEVNRYISWPGQACSYKIGELKIKEIREKANAILGDSFNLKKFHHQILKLGPVPLSVLENRINVWVDRGGVDHSSRIVSSSSVLIASFTFVLTVLVCQ